MTEDKRSVILAPVEATYVMWRELLVGPDILFETAGIEIPLWMPPGVAFLISFFTSMGGISGAFLLLPFQMSVLGFTNPSVSATNHLFNVIGIPGGVFRYYREGRMVWPLAGIIIAGTLPGVLIGAVVRVAYLPDPRHFKLFAAVVLLYIGLRLARDLLEKRSNEMRKVDTAEPRRPARGRSSQTKSTSSREVGIVDFNVKRLRYTFQDELFTVPVKRLLLLSFVVGIVGGIYGVGGGAIIGPLLVSVFGLPVYTVAGAALLGTCVASLTAVAFYQIMTLSYSHISVAPDWLLGFLFGIGGMAGMYLGARCQKYVPAAAIKWMLTAIIVCAAVKYVADFWQ